MATSNPRASIYFGEDRDEVMLRLRTLAERIIPDEESGQRGAKLAIFLRCLSNVDSKQLQQIMGEVIEKI